MVLPGSFRIALSILSCCACVSARLTWGRTKYLFVFGDSYTTTGFNISAGVDSPVPGRTSSNGPNWVQALGDRYNVTNTKVFNLASGGATIDSALVPPYLPTVLSIVQQVEQFTSILAPKPAGAEWQSDDSLFAIWVGINDVGNSFPWTNVTEPAFFETLMDRLTTQLEELYTHGARSFLLLTVPPTDRAPLWIAQGPTIAEQLKQSNLQYNDLLQQTVSSFQDAHGDLDQVTVFDTQPVFNVLLDNAKTLGYVNETGYCDAYANGTKGNWTAQIDPCAPVSSYFWLNSLHPLFTVHDVLAHAISTTLSYSQTTN